jgi:hypothetical protein
VDSFDIQNPSGYEDAVTISSIFPTGDTNGYHVSEIDIISLRGIFIPRKEIKTVLREEVLDTGAVYFLFEKNDEEVSKTKVYIGQSENFENRIQVHDKKKMYWDVAIVFVSADGKSPLDAAEIKLLEYLSITSAMKAKRYIVAQNIPAQRRVNSRTRARAAKMFKTIDRLLTYHGYPLFKLKVEDMEKVSEENLFQLISNPRKVDGKAVYTNEGMVVLAGSKIADTPTNSFTLEDRIQKFKDEGIISMDNYFQEDYIFSSPSTAARMVYRGSANGWTKWKRIKDGKTLDEVYRSNNI